MSGAVVLAGGTPQPDPNVPGQILLPWGEAPIWNVCEPSRLIVESISASFSFAPLKAGRVSWGTQQQNALDPHPAFSGARTGYPLEGPFIRYRVARGHMGPRLPGQPTVRGTFDETTWFFDYFFDLQVKRPIWLPYPGSLSALSQYPGQWTFHSVLIESADQTTERPSPLESEVTLSMNLAPSDAVTPSSRLCNGIPPGAHSYTYRDQNSSNDPTQPLPTISPFFDNDPTKNDVAPGGALRTVVPLKDPYTISSAYFTRADLGNAVGLNIIAAGNQGRGQLVWHTSLM